MHRCQTLGLYQHTAAHCVTETFWKFSRWHQLKGEVDHAEQHGTFGSFFKELLFKVGPSVLCVCLFPLPVFKPLEQLAVKTLRQVGNLVRDVCKQRRI